MNGGNEIDVVDFSDGAVRANNLMSIRVNFQDFIALRQADINHPVMGVERHAEQRNHLPADAWA